MTSVYMYMPLPVQGTTFTQVLLGAMYLVHRTLLETTANNARDLLIPPEGSMNMIA